LFGTISRYHLDLRVISIWVHLS